MDVKTGKRAVWEHAKRVGMSDMIAAVAKHFDIADISIISDNNTQLSYIERKPERMTRVKPGARGVELKEVLADAKQTKMRYKK